MSPRKIKDTIEEACREILRAEARREEVEALSTMRGMDLAGPAVMEGAWRPCRQCRGTPITGLITTRAEWRR
jgi:hypothetical protein